MASFPCLLYLIRCESAGQTAFSRFTVGMDRRNGKGEVDLAKREEVSETCRVIGWLGCLHGAEGRLLSRRMGESSWSVPRINSGNPVYY